MWYFNQLIVQMTTTYVTIPSARKKHMCFAVYSELESPKTLCSAKSQTSVLRQITVIEHEAKPWDNDVEYMEEHTGRNPQSAQDSY